MVFKRPAVYSGGSRSRILAIACGTRCAMYKICSFALNCTAPKSAIKITAAPARSLRSARCRRFFYKAISGRVIAGTFFPALAIRFCSYPSFTLPAFIFSVTRVFCQIPPQLRYPVRSLQAVRSRSPDERRHLF